VATATTKVSATTAAKVAAAATTVPAATSLRHSTHRTHEHQHGARQHRRQNRFPEHLKDLVFHWNASKPSP
jgi:hypothetical protein